MKIGIKPVSFFIVIILVVVTGACAINNAHDNSAVRDKAKEITLSENDNNGVFGLSIGDVITLRLASIPGTGYSWYIAKNDNRLMELTGEPGYETPETKLIGGTAYKIFLFRANSSGRNVLELHYKRIWEKDKEPLKTFTITININ